MDTVLDFLADNYKWFMGGAIVLLVALVGFIVDGRKKRNKGEELPESTTTISQVDAAAQAENVIPTQEVEPSLVFEQPSLNENETMNELKETGVEQSLTFENPAETSNPINYNVAVNDNSAAEQVTTSDMMYNPVPETPVAVETPVSVAPIETFDAMTPPVAPVMETPPVETPTPVVDIPVVETPAAPVAPNDNNTPIV